MAHRRFNGCESPLLFHIGRGLKIAHLLRWEIPSPRVWIYLSSTNSYREPALCQTQSSAWRYRREETQEGGDTDISLQRLLVHCGKIFLSRKFLYTMVRSVIQESLGLTWAAARVSMDCWEGKHGNCDARQGRAIRRIFKASDAHTESPKSR